MVSAAPTRKRVTHLSPLALAVAILTVVAVICVPTPSQADTVPADPSEPGTVSSDALPTVQIDGVVWSQAILGDTVFAGGKFTSARPAGAAAGVSTTPRSNLLSYSLSTGAMNSSFAPNVNGQILVTSLSPDMTRLYIGGDFTSVNGVTRNRVAALDTTTGSLLPFDPNANSTVRTILAFGDSVYVGGEFTAVSNTARSRAAAFTASTGSILPWAPTAAAGGVYGIVVSPDGSRVALGGRFTSLNAGSNPGYGLGMVAATGDGKSNLPMPANAVVRNGGPKSAILAMTSDGDSFYAGGYVFGAGGNLEGITRIRWADGTIVWVQDCHGDTYSVYPVGGVVYDSSHAHDCQTVPKGFKETNPRSNWQAVAFTKDVRGQLTKTPASGYVSFAGQPAPAQLDWFPQFTVGTFTGQYQATWTVTGDGKYVIFGGEFVAVNGKAQQGLVRFAAKEIAPNKDGPRLSNADFTPKAASNAPGAVTVSWTSNWDRDNELLTYSVIRDGDSASPIAVLSGKSRWYQRPTLTFTDAGLVGGSSHSYRIRAVDPLGNAVEGSTVTATARTGTSNTVPTAAFTSSTTLLDATFDGSASSDDSGRITSYRWDYGDGSNGTGVTSSHSYTAAGTYQARLTVTDGTGLTGSKTLPVTVTASQPVPGDLAADDFTRTSASGWGTATSGTAWTSTGSVYSVNGSQGVMTVASGGSTSTTRLPLVSASTSTDVVVAAVLPQAVTGGSAFLSLLGRTVGTEDYRTRAIVSTNGAVTLTASRGETALASAVVAGLTYAPGEVLNLRVQVVGTAPTTVRAKAWKSGTTEPSAWLVTGTDSTSSLQTAGGIGLSSYFGSASTVMPRTVLFDDLRAVAVP